MMSTRDPSPPYTDIDTASFMLAPQEDWTYTMRRDMQEIVPGVYLGPYAAAGKKNLSKLESVGITHIVCVRQEVEKNFIKPNFESQMQYLVVTLADTCVEAIIPKIKETKKFIDTCLRTGGKVLVHCNDGMSRSASLVIAYIMQTFGLNFKTALNHVQQRRFCVQPNDGFEQQLKEFEPIYRAITENTMTENSSVSKRSRDEESDDDLEGSCEVGVKFRVQDISRGENMET